MTDSDPTAAWPPVAEAPQAVTPRRAVVEIADIAGSILKVAVIFAFFAYLVYAAHGGH